MRPEVQIKFQKIIQSFKDGNFYHAESMISVMLQEDHGNFNSIFQLGISYAKNGEHDLALRVLTLLHNQFGANSQLLYNLGLIHSLMGNHQEALVAYLSAHEKDSFDVEIYVNLSSTYSDLKNFPKALEAAELAIDIDPKIPEAWSNKGIALSNMSRYHEAVDAYDWAISLDSGYAEAWSNKSVPLMRLKQYALAKEACDKAISIKPNYAEAWCNKGTVLAESGDHQAAIGCFENALISRPNYIQAWSGKGNALNDLGFYKHAIDAYDRAISIDSKYVDAWSNKACSLHEIKQYKEALKCHQQAVALRQDSAQAWFNYGVTLHELRQYENALKNYDRAIELCPAYAQAWFNKGVTFNISKKYNEALVCYEKAINLKHKIDWMTGDLVHLEMNICAWDKLHQYTKDVIVNILADQKITTPLPLISLSDDALLQRKSSEIYSFNQFPQISSLGQISNFISHSKIRLGYFSADFRNHPVSFLTAELFELHDRDRFEVYAFSVRSAEPGDAMRERLVNAFDHFIDVEHKTDIEVAQLARELEIDIAIDLGGHTQFAPTGIMSYRAAPIQINYLGYPGTMGAPYMDYIIADPILIPPENQQFYSEKVIYLPNCYQPNDRKKVISPRKFTRAEVGLPEKGFIFCSFNNNFKILPQTFASWMNILKKVEGGVLWLLEDNSLAAENLRKEAQKAGINPDRLIFAQRVPHAEHLARHELADLFLDTYPYNAHTTASDALWAGLPLITIQGSSFASRVASSLLTAVGLEELITQSSEQYETLAVSLSSDRPRINLLKTKLAGCKASSLLYDSKTLTKNIEDCYLKIFAR